MTSMIPFLIPSIEQSRTEERLAAAEHNRLVRELTESRGTIEQLRRLAGATLVRVGEWVSPARRETADQVSDPALIRLAR